MEKTEKLFIVKVTDLEFKGVEYVKILSCNVAFPLTPLAQEAIPVTKEQWENCDLREKLQGKTFWKKLSWGSEKKPKYRVALVKYIPDVKDLIPVYVQKNNPHFSLTDVKNYLKKAGVKVLLSEKGRYSDRYSPEFHYFDILYFREQDLETVEDLVRTLKTQIDIGFACPDRNVSASDKLTYK